MAIGTDNPNIGSVSNVIDTNRLDDYHLSLSIDGNLFSYAVLDKKRGEFLDVRTDLSMEQVIKDLGYEFSSVTCVLRSQQATLVPASLYQSENQDQFLKLSFDIEDDTSVEMNWLNNKNIANVFCFPSTIKKQLIKQFPGVQLLHSSSVFIEAILKNQPMGSFFINFSPTFFELLVVENNEISFYNTFQYSSTEDVAYYLFYCAKQLDIKPQTISLSLYGESSNEIESLLNDYVKEVKKGDLFIIFDAKLQSKAHSRAFSLLSQHLCV